MYFSRLLFALCLCCSSLCFAWTEIGHRVIAEIAWQQLTQTEQRMLAQLLQIPEQTSLHSHIMQDASVAMDNDKSLTHAFDNWHYIGNALVDSPVRATKPVTPPHIMWALNEASSAMKKQTATIQACGTSRSAVSHLMVEAFLHLTADIHQPLHCVERYSEAHPEGDKGGNLFNVIVDGKTINLHLYWDLGLGVFGTPHKSQKENEMTQEKISKLALEIMKEFPLSQLLTQSQESNYATWAKESYELARDKVYQTKEGEAVSDAYIKEGQRISKQRAALAAYRLSTQLKGLLPKSPS